MPNTIEPAMQLETRVVVDETWVRSNMSWLQSALTMPANAPQKAEFIENSRQAFIESAQAIANTAFKLGIEHAKRNLL